MLSWINTPEAPYSRFLFLDRDGVINVDRPDYVKHWGEYLFYPDALKALRRLRELKINVILISNQSALNRGITRWDDFLDIHSRMVDAIEEAGGELLAAFYCPHRPDENCSCRKPSPGMILSACKLYPIPLENSYMIGDKATDVLAAAEAGCRGVLLERSPDEEGLSGDSHRTVERTGLRYSTLEQAVEALYG